MYKVWATNDVVNAADLNAVLSDPVQPPDVVTAEPCTSTVYGDLATVGPVTSSITMVSGQTALVIVSARIDTPVASTTEGYMSFAVTGIESVAATDANAGRIVSNTSFSIQLTVTRASVFTAAATGSHIFTAKYKSSTGASYTFRDRRIIVKKF